MTAGRPLSSTYSLELGFSFNKNLGNNLLPFKNATMNQDFDYGILVDGPEGSGKSVVGMQIAHFLDRDHHLDINTQICFTPEEVKRAITTLEKGKAIVWDEARRGLNRRRSTQEINIAITDLLAECRQNNLFLIIIMPSFYDMDMNVAVWRTRALVHVWYEIDLEKMETPLVRGFFRFYSEKGKKMLYTNKNLRQSYEYPYMKDMSFEGRFPHHYVVDEKIYRKKKRNSERDYRERNGVAIGAELLGLIVHRLDKCGVLPHGSLSAIAKEFGIGSRTLERYKSAAAADPSNHNLREGNIEDEANL